MCPIMIRNVIFFLFFASVTLTEAVQRSSSRNTTSTGILNRRHNVTDVHRTTTNSSGHHDSSIDTYDARPVRASTFNNPSSYPSWLYSNGSAPSLPANFTETSNKSTVCYGVLGCFNRLEFFDAWKRPINLWPQSPEDVNVTLSLYTDRNKSKPDVLRYNVTQQELSASHFDPKKPTKFIIHGYYESHEKEWTKDIKDLIFELEPSKFNVFAVDWSDGAGSLIYHQAVANCRTVGASVAFFIQKLVEFTRTKVENIHIIGHSLGAHVSGYIGERFKNPKIGRITALDAAGPSFYVDDPDLRLDPMDATYVDALHTDFGNLVVEGLGLEDAIGDDDFYPNSGYRQPGCKITKGLFNVLSSGLTEGVLKTVGCNHQRSWGLFLANPKHMDDKCQFVGYECNDYESFAKGKCSDCGNDGRKCGLFSQMGIDDRTTVHHYQVKIKMNDDMPRTALGSIKLSLNGSGNSVDDITISSKNASFETGNDFTALVTSVKSLGTVDRANLSWSLRDKQVSDPTKPSIHVREIEINYMSNIDPKIRTQFSTVLCPTSSGVVESRNSTVFMKCKHRTSQTDAIVNRNNTRISSNQSHTQSLHSLNS